MFRQARRDAGHAASQSSAQKAPDGQRSQSERGGIGLAPRVELIDVDDEALPVGERNYGDRHPIWDKVTVPLITRAGNASDLRPCRFSWVTVDDPDLGTKVGAGTGTFRMSRK